MFVLEKGKKMVSGFQCIIVVLVSLISPVMILGDAWGQTVNLPETGQTACYG